MSEDKGENPLVIYGNKVSRCFNIVVIAVIIVLSIMSYSVREEEYDRHKLFERFAFE